MILFLEFLSHLYNFLFCIIEKVYPIISSVQGILNYQKNRLHLPSFLLSLKQHCSTSKGTKRNMIQQQRIDYTLYNLVSYYLLCLFAITFVVFMASTQSFVLTDILGVKEHIVRLSEFVFVLKATQRF